MPLSYLPRLYNFPRFGPFQGFRQVAPPRERGVEFGDGWGVPPDPGETAFSLRGAAPGQGSSKLLRGIFQPSLDGKDLL